MKKHFCDLCNSEINFEDNDGSIFFMTAGFIQYSKNRKCQYKKLYTSTFRKYELCNKCFNNIVEHIKEINPDADPANR